MKTNFERAGFFAVAISIVCLMGGSSRLQAQEAPPAANGFIRIVIGISHGNGNVGVRVDDREIYPAGYKPGAVTGGIGLAPGGHRVSFRRDGVTTGSAGITVEKGMTLALICYSEEFVKADGQAALPKMRILRLKPQEAEKGKLATFASVSRIPELQVDLRNPDKKWEEVRVKRLGTSVVPVEQVRGYVAMRSGGHPLDAIPVAEDGTYVVVLFDDAEGRLRSVNFRDAGALTGD